MKLLDYWKDIPDYEGMYQASYSGNIRGLDRKKPFINNTKINIRGRIRKPFTDELGRKVLLLSKNKKQRRFRIHQLVMRAFVGFPKKGMCVCHNDGNPSNNHCPNLRYDTQKGNLKDRTKHGTALTGERCHFSKLKEGEVLLIKTLLHKRIPQTLIAKMFKISQTNVSDIKIGKIWSYLYA